MKLTKATVSKFLIKRWDKEDPIIAAALAKVSNLEAKLVAALPTQLKRRYKSDKPLPAFGDDRPYRFDLSKGQCWVAWRALDLGWSKDLHGKAERSFRDSGGRMDHRVERIGKKYQWIAYNELCGYLIDYHWYFGDWGDSPVPFNWVDSYDRRDIDPSIWLDESVMGIKSDRRIPILSSPSTDFQASSVDAALEWTRSFDDLLEPLKVIEAADTNGERWWTTRLWYRDNGYLDKGQTTEAFQTAQAAVCMILVRQGDVNQFIKVSRGFNFGGEPMLGGSETMPVLMGEHAWDTGVLSGSKKGRIELPEKFHGVSYCVPSVGIDTKRGEYDFSVASDKFITVPNGDLVAVMKLHVESPTSYTFVEHDGHAAFIDVEATQPDVDRTIIRAAALERALAPQNLCPLWIFWSEKDGGLGQGPHFAMRHGQFSRNVFGGCYWLENGTWKSSGIWLRRG